MSKVRRFLLVVLALFVIVAGIIWLRLASADREIAAVTGTANLSVRPSRDFTQPVNGGTATLVGETISRRGSNAVVQLPPKDTPLVDIYPSLRKASDEGDFMASCRIAAELTRCQLMLPLTLQKLERAMEKLEKMPVDSIERGRLEKYVADKKADSSRDTRVCADFHGGDEDKAWKFHLRAALQGHRPSMASFASVPTWDPLDLNANLDAWVAWRKYAGTFLEASAAFGDRTSIRTLATEYSDQSVLGPSGLPGLRRVSQNRERGLMYALVGLALDEARGDVTEQYRSGVSALSAEVTPEQRTRAKESADALVATWDSSILRHVNEGREVNDRSEYDKPCH